MHYGAPRSGDGWACVVPAPLTAINAARFTATLTTAPFATPPWEADGGGGGARLSFVFKGTTGAGGRFAVEARYLAMHFV